VPLWLQPEKEQESWFRLFKKKKKKLKKLRNNYSSNLQKAIKSEVKEWIAHVNNHIDLGRGYRP
jgi:spermidine/putrescine-binding protein